MPSGAKKRKAAKKKKKSGGEVEPEEGFNSNKDQLNSVSTSAESQFHGGEDLKQESDCGEVSSPASQDHQNHRHQFTEGDEENGEKQLEVLRDRNKSNSVTIEGSEVEIVAKEDGGLVQVEKVEGESESPNMNIELAEPVRESPERGLRRSSSSSSSTSGSSEEKADVVDEKNIVVDNVPAVQSVKETDSSVDNQVTESPLRTEAYNSIVETASTSDLDKTAISEDTFQVTTSAQDTGDVASHTVGSALKENVEQKSGVVDEKAGVSEVLVDARLEKRIDEASAALDDGSVTTKDAKAFAAVENEDKIELLYSTPTIDANVHADNVKDTLDRECHDHQPPVALAQRPVQTTSWKSCCGLLEVFAGSNR